jgi:predicted dehydrogenase
MKAMRVGIVGLGIMGRAHARTCALSPATDLVAVCDTDRDRLSAVGRELAATVGNREANRVEGYTDPASLMEDSGAEAVIIATPHYFHTPVAVDAFERGLHVLCEKPIAVHVNDARRMLDAHEAACRISPNLVFGTMFQLRTFAHWRSIKQLVSDGSLGQLVRATWIITDWFRTQRYYDLSEWRATWRGEGGGVLLNQCPHNLDLYQWLFGMPTQVRGLVSIGKYHAIEVEDEVTAVFEHENGMTGHFIASTAESPGTNRLEIVGDLGRVVYEDRRLTVDRNEQSMLDVSRTSDLPFDRVPYTSLTHETGSNEGGHREVIERFAKAVRGEAEVFATGADGLGSVMIANAVILSHFTHAPVSLPLDGEAYFNLLQELIARSPIA